MAFQTRLGFMNEADLHDFTERFLPKLPGCRTVPDDTPPPDSEVSSAFTHWMRLSISSPTAARDLCHQLTAFLSHHKQSAALLEWQGGDSSAQTVQLSSQQLRSAEVAAVRLSASVKAHNDAEKATAKEAEE